MKEMNPDWSKRKELLALDGTYYDTTITCTRDPCSERRITYQLHAPYPNATPNLQHTEQDNKLCACGSIHVLNQVPKIYAFINGEPVTTVAYDKRDPKDKVAGRLKKVNNSGIVTWVNNGVLKDHGKWDGRELMVEARRASDAARDAERPRLIQLLGVDEHGRYGLTCIGCGKKFNSASNRSSHEKTCKLVKDEFPDWNEKSQKERKELALEVAEARRKEAEETKEEEGVEETKG